MMKTYVLLEAGGFKATNEFKYLGELFMSSNACEEIRAWRVAGNRAYALQDRLKSKLLSWDLKNKI